MITGIFFGLCGLLLLGTLALGLFGLLFKSNRNDKEYVNDVKSIGWTAIQWFILLPLTLVVAVIVGLVFIINM